LEENAFVD